MIYDGVRFHDDPAKNESRLRMAAMVSQLDAKIGKFVAALERSGQRERTLIVFMSDNGGIESLKNVYVGDWLPTVAGLVGLVPESDPRWDGLDRWKVISGEDATSAPRTIYIAHMQGQALLRGGWKIIRSKDATPQLFDIVNDPYGRENLASARPEKLREMIGLLDAELAKDDPAIPADLKGLPL